MISGIILSAGESKRMEGLLKPVLEFKGKKFIEIIIERMKEVVDEVIVVLGANREKILKEVDFKEVKVVINENWMEGQISSLREGIKNISKSSEGVLFNLVDHPLVKLETYKKLVEIWKKNKEKIIIPLYNGRKGHPAIFPEKFFKEILYKELRNGAREIIRKNLKEVVYIPVDDEGILIDIDTKKDYERIKSVTCFTSF